MWLSFFATNRLTAIAFATAAEPPEGVAIDDGVSTQIAYALGASDRVDETSTWPPEAREKSQLGYFRSLSAACILALEPDLLLASPHPGTEIALDQVRARRRPRRALSDRS